MNPDTIFILYELGHVEELERFFRERPDELTGSLVVALTLDVEAKLTERNVAFSSGRRYKQQSYSKLTAEDEMTATFFTDSRWALFNYRGVALQTTFLFMFRSYLQRVWYYGNLLVSIIETHPSVRRFVLFAPSGIVSKVSGALAEREVHVVVDCAKTVAATRGISIVVIQPPFLLASLCNSTSLFFFTVKRALFGLFLTIWNVAIVILLRPRRPLLLISDYWRNVGSSVELLKEAECIFLDRMEIRHINWRALMRYRMRFVHSENFLSRHMRMRARECAREFTEVWSNMRSSIAPVFICRGYSFDPMLLRAIDSIVGSFEKLICEIEGTYALYEHLCPDLVMLRASVSGQTHFSVLPLIAKNCGIPSLELQHGLEHLGPGSMSREHTAEYIAVYGALVKKELLSIGYTPKRVREIGSPRFDDHRVPVMDDTTRKFTVLCIAFEDRLVDGYDSYSAEDYLNEIARAVETIPDVHVIIRLRSGPVIDGFPNAVVASAFSRVSYTVAKSESLPDLFARSDVVVSCYSTAVLEALQCGMPVVISALNPVRAKSIRFHFSQYSDAHALYIAYNGKELIETLTELASNSALRSSVRAKAQEFIARNFCFDGNSSVRLASLIIELANRPVPDNIQS